MNRPPPFRGPTNRTRTGFTPSVRRTSSGNRSRRSRPAARLAILVGDPTKAGPYVIRVKIPAETKMMPHKHPEDRIYTVLSGVFYIGLGEVFDESKLNAYAPGSVVVLPGGQSHFHWAKSGEYVTQVSAIGPLGLEYVDPVDDPRNTGEAR
jgi:quercetin dioxygenase-like cupin family protein